MTKTKIAKSKKPDVRLTGKSATRQPKAAIPAAVEYRTEDADLLLAELCPGDNYRTQIAEAPLDDLTASIQTHGIRTRLWVRPLDKPTKAGALYEIIAGERAGWITDHLLLNLDTIHVAAKTAVDDEIRARAGMKTGVLL